MVVRVAAIVLGTAAVLTVLALAAAAFEEEKRDPS
jgi:hypothetical protein